jgi:chromosome segregation ATPase
MAENEIRTQIKEKEEHLKRIEEELTLQQAKFEKKLEEEFDPRISEIESKLSFEQNNLDMISENYEGSKLDEKEIRKAIKNLIKEIKAEKEVETINEQRIQELEANLENQKSKLGEATANYEEWKIKYKELKKLVKNFTKEAKTLNKEKSKALKNKIKEITGEKKPEIKAIKAEIKALHKELAILEKTTTSEI